MKKLLLTMFLVIALTLSFAAPVLAGDPVVSIEVTSPGGGVTDVTVTGIDSSGNHPGEVGQTNQFTAEGAYTVSYRSYAGNFGSLKSYVNASSTTGAIFTMVDTQDFDILSANHNYGTVGTFLTGASGPNAAMNLKSIGSMYVWSEATNGGVGLQGTNIYKQYNMKTDEVLTASMLIQAVTDGIASISNSAAWGFGGWETGVISTNYSGGTRILTASGSGSYTQSVNAGSSIVSNASMIIDDTPVVVATTLPNGGAASIVANFLNSFTANPYTVTAK